MLECNIQRERERERERAVQQYIGKRSSIMSANIYGDDRMSESYELLLHMIEMRTMHETAQLLT